MPVAAVVVFSSLELLEPAGLAAVVMVAQTGQQVLLEVPILAAAGVLVGLGIQEARLQAAQAAPALSS
jgi:hypothetical protein